MSERAVSNTGEMIPEDFEGKLNWANKTIGNYVTDGILGGLSRTERDNPSTDIALFSRDFSKALNIHSYTNTVNNLVRIVKIVGCTRDDEADTYTVKEEPTAQPGMILRWTIESGLVRASSFEDFKGQEREKALGSLVVLLDSPDIELVEYDRVFPPESSVSN